MRTLLARCNGTLIGGLAVSTIDESRAVACTHTVYHVSNNSLHTMLQKKREEQQKEIDELEKQIAAMNETHFESKCADRHSFERVAAQLCVCV